MSPHEASIPIRVLDLPETRAALVEAREKIGMAVARVRELEGDLQAILDVVDEQAEDPALWALNLDGTLPISEAYLQQELRRLHAVVEQRARWKEPSVGGGS